MSTTLLSAHQVKRKACSISFMNTWKSGSSCCAWKKSTHTHTDTHVLSFASFTLLHIFTPLTNWNVHQRSTLKSIKIVYDRLNEWPVTNNECKPTECNLSFKSLTDPLKICLLITAVCNTLSPWMGFFIKSLELRYHLAAGSMGALPFMHLTE